MWTSIFCITLTVVDLNITVLQDNFLRLYTLSANAENEDVM